MPAQLADPPRATRPGADGALRGRVGAPRLCGVKRTESKPEQELLDHAELARRGRFEFGLNPAVRGLRVPEDELKAAFELFNYRSYTGVRLHGNQKLAESSGARAV